jgi:hypothetical protein
VLLRTQSSTDWSSKVHDAGLPHPQRGAGVVQHPMELYKATIPTGKDWDAVNHWSIAVVLLGFG